MSEAVAVLDSSAVLAFLQRERGAENVEPYLGRACLPAPCLVEVVTKLIDGGMSDLDARQAILSLALEIMPLDEVDAWHAGTLRKDTRHAGLSLADRACLVAAARLKLPAVTSDQRWRQVGSDAELVFIR